jgi:hypothetical protein
MADFTLAEVENIANSTLEFFLDRRKVEPQTLQDKPFLKALRETESTFPGGKDTLSGPIKFDYTTSIQGFVNDDSVGYANPVNARRYNYPWKLIHAGIQFSMHELAIDGISVTDSVTGKNTSEHSDRELTALVNILEDKFDDLEEGTDRGFNAMYWADGSSDPKLVPGIASIILDDPTTATVVGGVDQSANTAWRNRASLGLNAGTPANMVVTTKLQKEYRQLRRYGGNPKLWLAGSDLIEALEKELRSAGTYSMDGFMSKGKTDTGMADISFKGNNIQYDPTLDDLGRSKFLHVFDMRHIKVKVIDGENMKRHNPARPENKYVFYRAKTWMGGLVCNKRNVHGVYSIA